ncbi:MAG TPA: hypothetical protein VFS59_08530 [Gemmatimonadaceae bacterium]|nr:hypothetical protein [Gemmatimonadaceae bacterium]
MPPLPPFRVVLALLVGAIACRSPQADVASPPAADFVLAAGDSSYWVTSDGGSITMRGAPLELARVDGRFYELYVADDDRSYEDAVLVGQRIFRRDLVTGDSLLVFEDTVVPRLAALYARLHPEDTPLRPTDEANEDPLWQATTTIDLVELHGPFLSYTLHADVERDDAAHWHTSRRGVIDLTTGRPASLARVVGGDVARIARRRTLAVASIVDSVRAGGSRIDRARTASLLRAYHLDPAGFTLTTLDGQPAVAYALSGRGEGDEGHLLELPPIHIGEPGWWTEALPSLPVASADGTRHVWRHGRYEVVARQDSSARVARLLLRDSTSREWPVGTVPVPASRVYWLDQPSVDSVTRRALTRAFDESVLYDDAVRAASFRRGRSQPAVGLARQRLASPHAALLLLRHGA